MKYLLSLLIIINFLHAQTIKDITTIVGIRDNQLLGYGLVAGLAGSGDKSKFTMQSLQNLLRNSYIKIPAQAIKSKNIAAVMVTAELPPFVRQGDTIRVKISAIGDAKSINHGVLLLTQLKGVNGKVYAIAQGSITANIDNLTTGYIPAGASIENEVNFALNKQKAITLSLIRNSAKDAYMIETKINKNFKKKLATALDTKTVFVKKPKDLSMIHFIALVQALDINTNLRKRIIIDMSKGTVIAGNNILIKPVTIAGSNFTLKIGKSPLDDKNWKNPAVNKGVDIGDDVKIGVNVQKIDFTNALIHSKQAPTLSDLMRAMKTMKLSIKEIISTIRNLKELGAINADLVIRR